MMIHTTNHFHDVATADMYDFDFHSYGMIGVFEIRIKSNFNQFQKSCKKTICHAPRDTVVPLFDALRNGTELQVRQFSRTWNSVDRSFFPVLNHSVAQCFRRGK